MILSQNIFPSYNLWLPKVPSWPFVKIASAFLAAFACFWYFQGLKTATISSLMIMTLAWILEFIAGHFGLFGGTYTYSGTFPGLAIGGTPLMLGPQHFAYYFFISYFVSNLIVDKSPENLVKYLEKKKPGVILQKGDFKATFLSQVWQQISSPAEFLDSLCLKAGLEKDAWRRGVDIKTYTIEKI